jgi:hypothetical protein
VHHFGHGFFSSFSGGMQAVVWSLIDGGGAAIFSRRLMLFP